MENSDLFTLTPDHKDKCGHIVSQSIIECRDGQRIARLKCRSRSCSDIAISSLASIGSSWIRQNQDSHSTRGISSQRTWLCAMEHHMLYLHHQSGARDARTTESSDWGGYRVKIDSRNISFHMSQISGEIWPQHRTSQRVRDCRLRGQHGYCEGELFLMSVRSGPKLIDRPANSQTRELSNRSISCPWSNIQPESQGEGSG